MRWNALVGAGVWVLVLIVGQLRWHELGWIELAFLFAPLAIVPLGLELTWRAEAGFARLLPERIARVLQLPGALAATASFLLPRGRVAAMLAAGWVLVCGLLALGGAVRIYDGGLRRLDSTFPIVAFLYLPVAGAWLVASRLGLSPLSFQEPIVLLTAVHFHYAGFAAALLARSACAVLIRAKRQAAAFANCVATGVLIGPGLLAIGFVVGPRVKLSAALLIAVSEVGLAVCFVQAICCVDDLRAKLLIGTAAASVIFSMFFAGIWAVGEYPLQPFVHLAEMARLHGTANALGFTFCGLLGWMRVARTTPNSRSV
jgi:hypothetical protein